MYRFLKALLFIVFTAVSIESCNNETPKINFGKDMCAFCKMTVIDEKFGALLINNKGKTLCFDCSECMVNYMKMDKDFHPEKILTIDYCNPRILIDAEKAHYLHGENIKSPMGGNIASFKTREDAERFQKTLQGDLMLWDKVLEIKF